MRCWKRLQQECTPSISPNYSQRVGQILLAGFSTEAKGTSQVEVSHASGGPKPLPAEPRESPPANRHHDPRINSKSPSQPDPLALLLAPKQPRQAIFDSQHVIDFLPSCTPSAMPPNLSFLERFEAISQVQVTRPATLSPLLRAKSPMLTIP